jgi:hypothetical protein
VKALLNNGLEKKIKQQQQAHYLCTTGLGEILSCCMCKLLQIEQVRKDMHDVTVLVHLFVRLNMGIKCVLHISLKLFF